MSAKDHPVANPQEFEAALAVVKPGDAVVYKAGTWQDVKLRFRAQGTAEQPVTLRAETPGQTIFEGASELVIDGEHLVVTGLKFQENAHVTEIVTPYAVTVAGVITFTAKANHCRLTETAIVDSGDGVTTYVHLEPGNRANRIDHCWFSNQRKIGVTFYVQVHPTQPNEHQIDHNYFGDRKQGTGNRWETLRIGHSEQQRFVSGTTVAHNYFYRCNGENECVSNKSTGNKYLYNSFIEVRGQLTLRHGGQAWIEGNYFFGGDEPDAEGVRMSDSGHVVINNYFKQLKQALIVYNGQVNAEPKGYEPVSDVLIAGNTLEDCAGNLAVGVNGREVPPKKLRIAWNLVQAKAGSIIRSPSPATEAAYEGNIMFGAALGIDTTGITQEKPVLKTDAWGRIFPDALQSPVRVRLEAFPELKKDLNGQPRTEPSNVGAIGPTSAEPLYPLTKQDVGPSWMKHSTP